MITPEDRREFPHHTDGAILGIKLIRGLQGFALRAIGDERNKPLDQAPKLRAVMELMGAMTNPNWIIGAVVDEMMDRDMITEEQHSEMSP